MGMGAGVLITGYLLVAVYTGARSFQGAVLRQPAVKLFTLSDWAVLAGLCVLVGIGWILFLPGLAVIAIRWLFRTARSIRGRWLPYPSAARARV